MSRAPLRGPVAAGPRRDPAHDMWVGRAGAEGVIGAPVCVARAPDPQAAARGF